MKGVYDRKAERVRKNLKGVAEWLWSHGGRTARDLKKDRKGIFVEMADGFGNYMKVYVPTNYK